MARNPLSPFRSGGLTGGGYASDPFLSLHREMNRLFDDVFRGAVGPSAQGGEQGGQGGMVMPHIDVSETDKEIRVCAELPGVKDEDVEVTLNNDILQIRGEKKFERNEEKENVHVMERSYGTFQRSLRIPYPVDPEQVQASFENGVLTVTLPRTQQQERSRRIQVQRGGAQASSTGDQSGSIGSSGSNTQAGQSGPSSRGPT